jgi:hypothetical protein
MKSKKIEERSYKGPGALGVQKLQILKEDQKEKLKKNDPSKTLV